MVHAPAEARPKSCKTTVKQGYGAWTKRCLHVPLVPPPLLCIAIACAQRYPPRQHTPSDSSLTPQLLCKGCATRVMQTQGHMNHKMSQALPVGMHVQLCSETGSVCHFFCREYLTLKSCTCSTGATGMGSPAANLAATWAADWAALLVEGLARGLAALGPGLAGGLAVGSSPCGKHNLGRHNTAPRTLEIDNSTSWVSVNMINING